MIEINAKEFASNDAGYDHFRHLYEQDRSAKALAGLVYFANKTGRKVRVETLKVCHWAAVSAPTRRDMQRGLEIDVPFVPKGVAGTLHLPPPQPTETDREIHPDNKIAMLRFLPDPDQGVELKPEYRTNVYGVPRISYFCGIIAERVHKTIRVVSF